MLNRRSSSQAKRGFFLVLVMLVIIVATFGVYSFTGMMVAYDDAAYLTGDIVCARIAADSGSEAVRLILAQTPLDRDAMGGVYNNPNLFQAVGVSNQDGGNVCNFSVVAPSLNELGQLAGMRFGLQDESSKLNLNTLTILDENSEGLMAALSLASSSSEVDEATAPTSLASSLLLALPGMTEELADSILDWLDEDDEPRPYGVEVDYYSTLTTPYEPTNGPVSSVEELLLVAGMTPTLLFGADTNRNGVLDPDEQQRFNVTVDTPGALGLAAYFTVHGNEANKARDGSFCVNINSDDLEVLYEDLSASLENDDYASFICAYRMAGQASSLAGVVSSNSNQANNQNNQEVEDGGVWSADYLAQIDLSAGGSVEFTQVLDLIDATVTISNGGQQVSYRSPFDLLTAASYLPIIMDRLSTSDTPTMPGRINLNECPAELLYGIPVLEEEQVGQILESRATESTDENRNFETWPMVEGIVTLDQMRQLLPLVNAGGDVYRAQIIGYFESSGLSSRQEVIIDATTVNPKVLFSRDLSHLGRAFDLSVLGIRNTAAVLGDDTN
ncbi:general secretion pathway protein GspK [Stieleria sp. JC731]|uniref:general secretion pathway protein GspK n=1 Tax=Pirellulaceae TaxID=2691357 RepID=UPI001E5384D4|nr:type II secretion system protein GspK [Stieleria sp. JC731]MCC9601671.1 general secretion pathway protein GspK [Stieleria sp. JC731]